MGRKFNFFSRFNHVSKLFKFSNEGQDFSFMFMLIFTVVLNHNLGINSLLFIHHILGKLNCFCTFGSPIKTNHLKYHHPPTYREECIAESDGNMITGGNSEWLNCRVKERQCPGWLV